MADAVSPIVARVRDAMLKVNRDSVGLLYTELFEAMARAAIEAMREPTHEMNVAAVPWNGAHYVVGDPPVVWGAMIDAALSPKQS